MAALRLVHKGLSFIALAFICGCIALSCNRNSLDLPAPTLQSTFDTSIGIGGQQQFLLHFQKTGFAGRDSLLLYIQNLGPTGYKNLDLVLEFTREDQPHYGSFYYHHLIHIDTLGPAGKSASMLLSADTSILSQNTRVHAGVIGYNGSLQPLAGDYSSFYSIFQVDSFGNSTTKQYANTEGYILADGSLHLRIATIGSTTRYYTLDGTLVDSLYFSGTLRDGSAGTTQVLLDTIGTGSHFDYDASLRMLSFRLKLQPSLTAEDSSNRILFRLHKN